MGFRCISKGVVGFLSLILWSHDVGAQSTTRQQILAAMDWKALPGEEFALDSRSPVSVTELMAGEGAPTKVDAHLWMPENARGRVPAVVLFNCGNTMVREKEGYYSDVFHRMGYAVLIVNSLSARAPGTSLSGADVFHFRLATMVDAIVALKTLAADRRIDSKRIAIMGWSNGGMSILGGAIEELLVKYAGPGLQFAAIVPISPQCGVATLGARFTSTLILSFHGEKDDFMSLKPCQFYRQEAAARGANFEMVVYPGDYHNWEMPFAVRRDPTQSSLRDCYVVTDLAQHSARMGTGATLTPATPNFVETIAAYLRSCSSMGITEGYDERSRADTHSRIPAFIQRAFADTR